MAKEFQDSHPQYRPLQAWQILISKASNRETIAYGNLASMMGYKAAPPIIQFLNKISDFCSYKDNKLPILSVIVVNQNTGVPSPGISKYVRAEDVKGEQGRVFDFDWCQHHPPNTGGF